jgi:3-deoxy-7-phosphoheptulonate synthase
MIVILAKHIAPKDKEMILIYLRDRGYTLREQQFEEDAIIGATGKGSADLQELRNLPGVESVKSTTKPYELASRDAKREDTIVTVGPVKIGGSRITVIAGPCAVESKSQIQEAAAMVRESGAVMLRGGAYKPRTSPYAFQGLGMQGLEYMKAAGEALGMPIVTEVVSPELAVQMYDLADMFQIGARNMQNFELLKKVGSLKKPVLLKRGPSATIEEWLLSAEYLLAAGSRDVVLCERGIRTFETYTRNTLDISVIPVVKELSHLPVLVDPSHAVGIRAKVPPVALSAIAAGADGLIVEAHPRPDEALSDGPQSLYPEQFERLMRDIEAMAPVVGKGLLRTPRRGFAPPQSLPVSPGKTAPDTAAFSGERGAFAEQALLRVFGEDAPRLGTASFRGVFEAVLDGSAIAGVMPVENSLTGSIHENYDLFLQYPDIAIVGELKLRVVHCLLGGAGASLDTIQVVRSHPQGFAQCLHFLDQHPEWRRETYTNTAGAASAVAEERSPLVAAIAGEDAAKAFGLTVLKAGIESNPLNYTRFVIIARRVGDTAPVPAGLGFDPPNKASIVFSVSDKPGSLFRALKILSDGGINLSKLESRPIHGQPWRYLFYADLSIPETDGIFRRVMEALQTETEDFRFLGSYRASL